MRYLSLLLVLLLPGFLLEASAQSAAPKPVFAFAAATEKPSYERATAPQTRLGDEAEQHRLKALAHLGLGNPEAARREADRLVGLVPDYLPLPNEPAAFALLVTDAQRRVSEGALKVRRGSSDVLLAGGK